MYTVETAIERLEEVTGMKFSEEQLKILRHEGGMDVVACAGAGKTTTLACVPIRRKMTGETHSFNRILMTTYSKAGAKQLTRKIKEYANLVGINDNAKVTTLHSAYWRILNKFNLVKPLCTDGQRKGFIRKTCKELKLGLEEEDIENIDSILSFQINNMMSNADIYKSYVFNVEISLENYAKIREGFVQKKREAGLIDFDDLQYYVYYYLCSPNKNEAFVKYCESLWDGFFVDEFQDTSKIQFEILKALIKDPRQLIVIGDDDQCIYGWRGADPSIILNICAYYDIQKFYLSTNYRCRKSILDFAAAGVKYMSKRENKDMKSFKPEGTVEILNANCTDLLGMSKTAYCSVVDAIDNRGVSPSQVCVLVRNNAHAQLLINMLISSNYECTYSADMKMSNNLYFKDLVAITKLIGNDMEPQTFSSQVVTGILWKLIPYFGTANSALIGELMQASSGNIVMVLGHVLEQYLAKDVGFHRQLRIDKVLEMKARARLGKLNYEVINNLCALYQGLSEEDLDKRFSFVMKMYFLGMQFMVASDVNTNRIFTGFINYYSGIFKEKGLNGVIDNINYTISYDESDKDPEIGDFINISTIHGSKGMEWDEVILMGYDNVSFPNLKYIVDSLDKGITEEDIENYIDGERRLAYVAITRAKNKSTIIGDYNNFSLFGLEALGKFPNSSTNEIINLAKAKIKYNKPMPEDMIVTEEDLKTLC